MAPTFHLRCLLLGASMAGLLTIAAASPASAGTAVAGKHHEAADGEPLERVRALLAERLGARPAGSGSGPYDVKVRTHGAQAAAAAGKPGRSGGARPGAQRAEAVRGRATPAAPHGWDYAGAGGPARWAALDPEYALCGSGTRQSPIDIRDGIAVPMDPPVFDYRETGFRVIDTGHTVQVDVDPGQGFEIQGRRYELQQFHFHRPSEELIDGKRFDMGVHLVHRDADGRIAVIAVLLQAGSEHPLVQRIWANLPLERHLPVTAAGRIDLASLLPEDRRHAMYMGSLTTPPCQEGVLWVVLMQPASLSDRQIDVFSRLYPMNARPVQAAAGRLIKQSP